MRFNAELSKERYQQIEALMELTGLSTKKDVLINALVLFSWAVRQRQEGRSIASIDAENANYREVVLPALENVPVIDGAAQAIETSVKMVLRNFRQDIAEKDIELITEALAERIIRHDRLVLGMKYVTPKANVDDPQPVVTEFVLDDPQPAPDMPDTSDTDVDNTRPVSDTAVDDARDSGSPD